MRRPLKPVTERPESEDLEDAGPVAVVTAPETVVEAGKILEMPLETVSLDEAQPRKHKDPKEQQLLEQSIFALRQITSAASFRQAQRARAFSTPT